MTKSSKLINEILKQSLCADWSVAKTEWKLASIDVAELEDKKSCLCGKTPIKKLCYMYNIRTNYNILVGSDCVLKVLGINTDGDFKRLKEKRVQELIREAYKNKLINNWEIEFIESIKNRRKLSLKQLSVCNKLEIKLKTKIWNAK